MLAPFKSFGHFLATFFQKGQPIIAKLSGTAAAVETATSVIPTYGPLLLTIEKASYAALGEIAAVLHAGGEVTTAKLADIGFDSNIVATVQAILASSKDVVNLVTDKPTQAPTAPTVIA